MRARVALPRPADLLREDARGYLRFHRRRVEGRRQEEVAADEQKHEEASPGLVEGECEDVADEVAAQIFEDGGAAYRSCAEAKEAGRCDDALAQYYCGASCGWCTACHGRYRK